MLRTLLGIVLGVIAMMITVHGIETIGHLLYPPPPGLDPNDLDQLDSIVASAPVGAMALLVVGWCVGTIVGSGLAARIARHPRVAACVVALVVVASVVAMAFLLPSHPTWVAVLGTLLPVPLALGMAKVAGRRGAQ
ncbi:MAG: hypothetical protein KF800_00640 [Lysobacter sp.]|nr:hypothetical protein [Lysobacter sp.]